MRLAIFLSYPSPAFRSLRRLCIHIRGQEMAEIAYKEAKRRQQYDTSTIIAHVTIHCHLIVMHNDFCLNFCLKSTFPSVGIRKYAFSLVPGNFPPFLGLCCRSASSEYSLHCFLTLFSIHSCV